MTGYMHFKILSYKQKAELFPSNGLDGLPPSLPPSLFPLRRIMTKWRHSAKETLKKKKAAAASN